MKKQHPGFILLLCAFTLLMYSCKKEIDRPQELTLDQRAAQSNPAEKFNVFKGPSVEVGNGHARSWIRMNHLGEPKELGMELTPGALTGLPDHHDIPTPDHTTIVLPLHQKAIEATTFEHIGLNWNPTGHPPPFLFMVPHFDIHFYMITNEERMAIPAYTPNSAFDIFPPAGYMPLNYAAGPGGEIAMGKHWSLPPAQIAPFTRTMILGTYDGELIFEEPMVTLDYLLSGASSTLPISQPAKFAEAGYYPTSYRVYVDDKGNHQVTLTDFVARTAH